MGLDLRNPIGLLLAAIGVLLVGYGLISDAAVYQRSLGINVNLIWGSVLFAAGLLFLLAARRAPRSDR